MGERERERWNTVSMERARPCRKWNDDESLLVLRERLGEEGPEEGEDEADEVLLPDEAARSFISGR